MAKAGATFVAVLAMVLSTAMAQEKCQSFGIRIRDNVYSKLIIAADLPSAPTAVAFHNNSAYYKLGDKQFRVPLDPNVWYDMEMPESEPADSTASTIYKTERFRLTNAHKMKMTKRGLAQPSIIRIREYGDFLVDSFADVGLAVLINDGALYAFDPFKVEPADSIAFAEEVNLYLAPGAKLVSFAIDRTNGDILAGVSDGKKGSLLLLSKLANTFEMTPNHQVKMLIRRSFERILYSLDDKIASIMLTTNKSAESLHLPGPILTKLKLAKNEIEEKIRKMREKYDDLVAQFKILKDNGRARRQISNEYCIATDDLNNIKRNTDEASFKVFSTSEAIFESIGSKSPAIQNKFKPSIQICPKVTPQECKVERETLFGAQSGRPSLK